jgi:AcrR family transcriptional regulator
VADRPGGPGGVLPRGRHGLSREEVEASQRARIMLALAEAMAEKGYATTSVADVLKRARVSRETFYEHHDSKLDCFLQTFDTAAAVLQASIGREVDGAAGTDGSHGDRGALLERSIGAYLDVLLAQPAFARLFLVESYAAGAAAIERRATVQARFADALLGMVGRSSEEDRIAAQALVAFIGTSVTMPLARNDLAALAALRPALITAARVLLDP